MIHGFDVTRHALLWSSLGLAACSGLLDIGKFSDKPDEEVIDADMPGEGGGGTGGATPDPRMGDPLWVEVFGGNGVDIGAALSIDSAGTLTLAGTVEAPAFFGDDTVGITGQQRMFVTTLDAQGEVNGVTASEGSARMSSTAVASTPSTIALGATLAGGTFTFLGASVAAASDSNGVVVLLDADLSLAALVEVGDVAAPLADQAVTAVAVAEDGSTIVAGWFDDDIQIGARSLTSAGSRDGFVAKLAANGSTVWLTPIAANGNEQVTALALRSDGAVYVAGSYDGDGPSPTNLEPTTGQIDVFVLLLTEGGEFAEHAAHYGGAGGRALPRSIAVLDDGVAIAGGFSRTITFDHVLVSGSDADDGDPQQTDDVFVARLDDALQPLWSRRFGGLSDDLALAVATDANGDVIAGGEYTSPSAFLPDSISESQGQADAFAVKLDGADGASVWAHAFGRHEIDRLTGIAVDADDEVTMAGTFQSGFSLGDEMVLGRAKEDVFVIRVSR